jgi:isochorismate hydrolase
MIRWWNTGLYAETEFSSIESGVKVSGEILVKHTYSAFHGTNLHENLQHSHIENLYIAGVLTNLCCETTARDAFLRNYNVFFVADATATYREDMHIATLLNLAHGFARIVFTGDIVEGCENGL